MKSITFVCLGNICRSPIAEGCAAKYIKENSLDMKVSSGGTGSWHVCEAPCANSVKVCKSNSIDISMLRASQFTHKDKDSYDLCSTR